MTVMKKATDILGIVSSRKAAGEPFVLATVVRTVAATSAKAGAKAVILPDGTISEGWIGGGCARAAVLKAANDALADGRSRLVSVEPPDELDKHGHRAGEEEGGVRFATNTCPSQGTMDIFVEPVLPRAQVVICGSSPVALAVADLAKRMGFAVTACAPPAEQAAFDDVDRRIEGYALPVEEAGERYVVVSTQGRGDESALAGGVCGRFGIRCICRQPQESRGAQSKTCGARRFCQTSAQSQGACGSRSWRDHAG